MTILYSLTINYSTYNVVMIIDNKQLYISPNASGDYFSFLEIESGELSWNNDWARFCLYKHMHNMRYVMSKFNKLKSFV